MPREVLTSGTNVQPPEGPHIYFYRVSWPKGKWPVLEPVKRIMDGPLPPQDLDLPGSGPFVEDPDHYIFPPGSSLLRHFMFWRFLQEGKYTVSSKGHPNTLRLLPSNANLTGLPDFDSLAGQTFIGRRQTDVLFKHSIDVQFTPRKNAEEASVTNLLTQDRHAVLGLVKKNGGHQLRFRAEELTLQRRSLKPCRHSGAIVVFRLRYRTMDGHGEDGTPTYFSDWKYQDLGQAVGIGEYVLSRGQSEC